MVAWILKIVGPLFMVMGVGGMPDDVTQWFSWITQLSTFLVSLDWTGDTGRWLFGIVGFLIIVLTYDGPRMIVQRFVPIGISRSPLKIEWAWEYPPFVISPHTVLADVQLCRVRIRNTSKKRAIEEVGVKVVRCILGNSKIQKYDPLSGENIDIPLPNFLQTSASPKRTTLPFLHESDAEFFDLVSYYRLKPQGEGHYQVALQLEGDGPNSNGMLFTHRILNDQEPAATDAYALTVEATGYDVPSTQKTLYFWLQDGHLHVRPTLTVLPKWTPLWAARAYYAMALRFQRES